MFISGNNILNLFMVEAFLIDLRLNGFEPAKMSAMRPIEPEGKAPIQDCFGSPFRGYCSYHSSVNWAWMTPSLFFLQDLFYLPSQGLADSKLIISKTDECNLRIPWQIIKKRQDQIQGWHSEEFNEGLPSKVTALPCTN